jgi:UDP-2,3-diacylglucosamine pyrophosphatase LpxH
VHHRVQSGEVPDQLTDADAAERRELLLFSDLHLSAGEAGAQEDFRHDAELARFLDHLGARAPGLRVIVLGDFLDFLTSEPPSGGPRRPNTTDAATLAKLDRIAAAHPVAIAALGRLLAAGARVTLVPGNHDIELLRPSTPARLARLAAEAAGDPAAAQRLDVAPWIVHVLGVLYAEHGNQYHDLNAWATVTQPWAPRRPGEIEQPLGSQLAAHGLGLGARPGRTARWARQGAFGLEAAGTVLGMGSRSRRRRAAEYRAGALGARAEEIGLPPATLAAIDRLSETSPAQMARRVARLAANRARRLPPPAGPADPPNPGTVEDRVIAAAQAIDGLLAEKSRSVPFYVFAHTHRPAAQPLRRPGGPPWYLNTGPWATTGSAQPAFSCVRIEVGDGAPVARLEAWNDAAGELQPLAAPLRAAG